MSFRVAARRVPTLALARPTVAPRAATSVAAIRLYSDKPSPEARASSIIDSLPGNSLVSKTGWVTLGTGLTAVAISKEIYVANEETVILVGSLIFAVLVGRAITGPYKEWADSQIEVRITTRRHRPHSRQQLWPSASDTQTRHACADGGNSVGAIGRQPERRTGSPRKGARQMKLCSGCTMQYCCRQRSTKQFPRQMVWLSHDGGSASTEPCRPSFASFVLNPALAIRLSPPPPQHRRLDRILETTTTRHLHHSIDLGGLSLTLRTCAGLLFEPSDRFECELMLTCGLVALSAFTENLEHPQRRSCQAHRGSSNSH